MIAICDRSSTHKAWPMPGSIHPAPAGIDSLVSIENVLGSNFADAIAGNASANEITGGGGNDFVGGLEGADLLRGGDGDDALAGGGGDDFVHGNAGDDSLWGGTDEDVFYFATDWGNDTVMDFENGLDVIDLTSVTGLTNGAGPCCPALSIDAVLPSPVAAGAVLHSLPCG